MKDFEKYATGKGISSLTVQDYSKHITNGMQPVVLEKGKLQMTAVDIYSRLLADGIIFLNDDVNHETAGIVQAQMLYLFETNPDRPIKFYINSPGGTVIDGLGIYDTMRLIDGAGTIVQTQCMGMAASMGSILLAAGSKGYRAAMKHGRIMIHQPMGGAFGQESDVAIAATQIKYYKKELYNILADHTGQPFKTIEKKADRDCWMSAEEAKNFGIIDKII